MNMTEKSERWPMTRVPMPSAQQRLVVSTSSMSTGLPNRAKAASRSPSVSAKARSVARDRKSTRLNSSHGYISYAVFCLKKKKKKQQNTQREYGIQKR